MRELPNDGTTRLGNGWSLLPDGQTRPLGEFELLQQNIEKEISSGNNDNNRRCLRSKK